MGLIDVLTQYDTKKKAAHAAKAVKHGVRDQCSAKCKGLLLLISDRLCVCVFCRQELRSQLFIQSNTLNASKSSSPKSLLSSGIRLIREEFSFAVVKASPIKD